MMTEELNQHPTPEQLLVRMALEQLTPRQKQIWSLYNYDKLTQEEIATKLHIRRQVVQKTVNQITNKVKKFCKLNRGAYMLLKLEQQIEEE